MASRRSGSDHSNGPVNYLDDVPFKLNDKFRCPSKVGLPIGLCLPDVALRLSELQYDFSLERRSVLWGEELERAREATPMEAEPDDQREAESACEEQELAPPALNPVLAGLRHNAILTPLPAPSLRRPPPVDPAPQSLNLADFEREEDPFDKLELKTLDDKEELRSILQSQPSPCGTPPPLKGAVLHKPNGLVGLLGVEGKGDADRPCNIRSLTFPKLSEPRDTPSGPPPTHSLSNGTPPRAGSGSGAAPPRDAQDCTQNGTKQAPGPRPTTTTILPSLSASERQCVETIVGMGYSYEGVLRAMQRQGQNVDQVLEYLFTHTRLCDQGFEAAAVEECLEMFQGSEEKALEFLQLMSRFGEMGFEKQVIKEVLLVHNNDQDRALEDLMARAAAS